MSNPTHPVYTFRLNLETLQRYSWLHPNRTILSGNETTTEADQVKNTRSSFLNSLFPGVEHVFHKDDETFTVYGYKAHYLKTVYATGTIDAILEVV